ncbi:MAG: GroES family chaperonin [Candidatus Limnocylindrales bacterium]
MSETVQPLGSRVLVRVMVQESVTASGLYVPDTAKEKPQRGEGGAGGADAELIKVAVGDRVLFPKYTGTEIRVADADHLIIESADLLAILRDAPVESVAA